MLLQTKTVFTTLISVSLLLFIFFLFRKFLKLNILKKYTFLLPLGIFLFSTILLPLLFFYFSFSHDILKLYYFKGDELYREYVDEVKKSNFTLCLKYDRCSNLIRPLPDLSQRMLKIYFKRAVYIPEKDGYIAEICEDGRKKLALLDGNLKIKEKFNLSSLSKGSILGRVSRDGTLFLFYGLDLKSGEKGICVLNLDNKKYFFTLKKIKFSKKALNGCWFNLYKNSGITFSKVDIKELKNCKFRLKISLFLYDFKMKKVKEIFEEENIYDFYPKIGCLVPSPDLRYFAYYLPSRGLIIKDLKGKKEYRINQCSYFLKFYKRNILWDFNLKYLVYFDTSIYNSTIIFNLHKHKYTTISSSVGYTPFFLHSKKIVSNVFKRRKKYLHYFILIYLLWFLDFNFLAFYKGRLIKKLNLIKIERFWDFLKFSLLFLSSIFSLYLLFSFLKLFLLFLMYTERAISIVNFDAFEMLYGAISPEKFLNFLLTLILISFLLMLNYTFLKGMDLKRIKGWVIFTILLITGFCFTIFNLWGILTEIVLSILVMEILILLFRKSCLIEDSNIKNQ